MPRAAPPDIARFKANKGRVNDYYEYNADSIREKRTVLASAKMFEEMAWLCAEIRRLGLSYADDPDRFKKIEKFVARVVDEQFNAIRTGQLVKIRCDIFSGWRFLVRTLETVLKSVLDLEDRLDLGGKLANDDGNRIVLDLEDGLGETEEEASEPVKPRRRHQPARQSASSEPPVTVSGVGLGGDEADDLPGGDVETGG